jgi:hypothetical protein
VEQLQMEQLQMEQQYGSPGRTGGVPMSALSHHRLDFSPGAAADTDSGVSAQKKRLEMMLAQLHQEQQLREAEMLQQQAEQQAQQQRQQMEQQAQQQRLQMEQQAQQQRLAEQQEQHQAMMKTVYDEMQAERQARLAQQAKIEIKEEVAAEKAKIEAENAHEAQRKESGAKTEHEEKRLGVEREVEGLGNGAAEKAATAATKAMPKMEEEGGSCAGVHRGRRGAGGSTSSGRRG